MPTKRRIAVYVHASTSARIPGRITAASSKKCLQHTTKTQKKQKEKPKQENSNSTNR